ncbi:hypothetical protein ACH4S9_36370 [Streptomyces sp. NPDC021225]|uniref:hypothetical protein n=1 Tax=Streptomyces sp. NPDC021225 TaxID=3365121 RepID=UPI00379F0A0A
MQKDVVGFRVPIAEGEKRPRGGQLIHHRADLGGGSGLQRHPESHGVLDPPVAVRGEPPGPVGRGVDRPQPGPARVVVLGPPGGGRAQLTEGTGEGGQPVAVGRRSVAPQQPVQGGARREVFQDHEPGRRVGGDDARGEGDPDVVPEKPERGHLGTQPPPGVTPLDGSALGPLDDNGRRHIRTSNPHPGHGPGLQPLPALDAQQLPQGCGAGAVALALAGLGHPLNLCTGIAERDRISGALAGRQ